MSDKIITQLYGIEELVVENISINDNYVLAHMERDSSIPRYCSYCGKESIGVKSYDTRIIRDLPILGKESFIQYKVAKIICPDCGVVVEKLSFLTPYSRITNRLKKAIASLCKHMTIKDIADYFKLDWKTIKAIAKENMREALSKREIKDIPYLAVDEFAVKKGHKYMTLVIDLTTGSILWVEEERKTESLARFFYSISKEARNSIKAIAMDMWPAFKKAVKRWCKQAVIVYDKFHVIKKLNEAIDKIRGEESRQNAQNSKTIKNGRFLLLKKRNNLTDGQKDRLELLLKLNKNLCKCYILKEDFAAIWEQRDKQGAAVYLNNWVNSVKSTGLEVMISFAKMVARNSEEILNFFHYPITSGKIEGTNNRIKTIKRMAFGFRDSEYFKLRILTMRL